MTVAAHQFLNPEELSPPVGFSHVAVAAPGRLVFLAGETAHQPDGTLAGSTMAEQFATAAANVAAALAAAGATPADVVSLQIFTTDVDGYRAESKAIGAAYRAVMGRHYPAMSLLVVHSLLEQRAKVEIEATAVVPDRGPA